MKKKLLKYIKNKKKLFEAIEERNISKEKLKSLESINSKLEQQLKVYENEISSLRDENEILVETNRVQSDKLKKEKDITISLSDNSFIEEQPLLTNDSNTCCKCNIL